MPLFIAALWGTLLSMAGSLVGKVLLSLGITYVTYTAVDTSITWAKNLFLSGMGGLPAAAVGMASTMKLGVCVSMILSAITARLVLDGLTAAGSVKKMALK